MLDAARRDLAESHRLIDPLGVRNSVLPQPLIHISAAEAAMHATDLDEEADAPELVHWYPAGRRFGLPMPGSPQALTAAALAATALGAMAIGALAIGALAIGRLAVGSARFRRLEIDDLVVRRLRILEP